MSDIVEELKNRYMDTKRMIPCGLEHRAANEIESLRRELSYAQREAAHWKNNHETEVRRARILKERTDMPIERVQAYERWCLDLAENAALRRKLAEKDAEIERLRGDFEIQQSQLGEMLEQLAASQDREQQLLEKVHLALTVNYSREFDDNRAAILQEALALPQDTSALEAMIAKAGEVMRERVMQARGKGPLYPLDIRAIPGVTLEDLK